MRRSTLVLLIGWVVAGLAALAAHSELGSVAAATTARYVYDDPTTTTDCVVSPARRADQVVRAGPDGSALLVSCSYDDALNSARTNARLVVGGLAPRALPPADVVVIGKVDDLTAATLRPGERTLLDQLQPNLGSPRLNYARNDSVLRAEMGRGVPLRDVSVDPVTGALRNNTGFLRAERNILTNHDWVFDPRSAYWYPPGL